MQINLKAHNATDLEFSAKITLTADLIAEMHRLSKPDSDGDSVFFHSYEKHRVLVVVGKADEKTFQADIEFIYQAKSGGRLSKRLPRISRLIDLLTPISQQLTFECAASFLFTKKLRAKPIIHLPQKYLELPDMPFDRIQGMHLVKLDGSEIKYNVFLEAPTQGVIGENITFKYTSKIDNNLANNILDEAIKISDQFVIRT